MKKINAEYIERINQIVNRSPYFELLSMEIKEVGIGFSLLEIDLAHGTSTLMLLPGKGFALDPPLPPKFI
jgi:hypothetical protein